MWPYLLAAVIVGGVALAEKKGSRKKTSVVDEPQREAVGAIPSRADAILAEVSEAMRRSRLNGPSWRMDTETPSRAGFDIRFVSVDEEGPTWSQEGERLPLGPVSVVYRSARTNGEWRVVGEMDVQPIDGDRYEIVVQNAGSRLFFMIHEYNAGFRFVGSNGCLCLAQAVSDRDQAFEASLTHFGDVIRLPR